MKIHIVMHESFEAPGSILDWCEKRNHLVTATHLYKGEALPTSSEKYDFLIVMGGPQSPATTIEECPHFDAQAEIALITDALRSDKAILGICLGAQLVGEALGATFDHSPNREIGLFPLELTEDGKKDPYFSTLPESFNVGHWHGDMPGLTSSSKILATSEGCPRQIVRYSPKVYGFQCHFEFTKESIEGMIENSKEELEKYKAMQFVEDEVNLRSHDFSEMSKYLFDFLDYIERLHMKAS